MLKPKKNEFGLGNQIKSKKIEKKNKNSRYKRRKIYSCILTLCHNIKLDIIDIYLIQGLTTLRNM